jgi:hypothetical protein
MLMRVPRRGLDIETLPASQYQQYFDTLSMRMVMVCQYASPGRSDASRPVTTS